MSIVGTSAAARRMARAPGNTLHPSLLSPLSPVPTAHAACLCLAVLETHVYGNQCPDLYCHTKIEALSMAQEAKGAHFARRQE
jgi:hypothetical protein